MKQLLITRLVILVLLSTIAINANSQVLPDPGDDPIHIVDSSSQHIDLKLIRLKSSDTSAIPADPASRNKPLNAIGHLSLNTKKKSKVILLKTRWRDYYSTKSKSGWHRYFQISYSHAKNNFYRKSFFFLLPHHSG